MNNHIQQSEPPLSHLQSLGIIEQMIATAKDDHRENGDGWLLWGWLLFGASVSSVILMELNRYSYISWLWTGMLIIGLAIGIGLAVLRPKPKVVTTFVSELLQKLGIGFFVSLLTMVAAGFITGQSSAFGYYYILYAFWMFIQGSALRFKPLIIGAIVNWAAAIAIFLLSDFYFTMLISAVAILVGYLIPGYMLRRQYNKSVIAR
jgi:Flp pilus assembly protein TadB